MISRSRPCRRAGRGDAGGRPGRPARPLARRTATCQAAMAIWLPPGALCSAAGRRSPRSTIPAELAELWSSTLEPEFHRVSWMLSAATRSAAGRRSSPPGSGCRRLVGPAGANAVTAGLGGGSRQLASLGLLDGLEQLTPARSTRHLQPAVRASRAARVRDLGPRPGEDPDWLGESAGRSASPEIIGRARREETKRARSGSAWIRLGHGSRCRPGCCDARSSVGRSPATVSRPEVR